MHTRSIAGLAALLLALLFSSAAQAATVNVTIGQVAPSAGPNTCDECSSLQERTAAGSPSYVVPGPPAGWRSWTLTSWSARGGTLPGLVEPQIWHPTGTPGEFRLATSSPLMTVPAGAVGSFPVSIPVQPGDVLGIRTGPSAVPIDFESSTDDAVLGAVGDPQPGQTSGAPTSDLGNFRSTGFRENISATLTATDVIRPKCKRKKHKKRAAESKKKKCKKRKKH